MLYHTHWAQLYGPCHISEGTLSGKAKPLLMTLLETNKCEVEEFPDGALWILDGGVWLRKLRQVDIQLHS